MKDMKDMYSLTVPITRAQSGVNAAYEVTNVCTKSRHQSCPCFIVHQRYPRRAGMPDHRAAAQLSPLPGRVETRQRLQPAPR